MLLLLTVFPAFMDWLTPSSPESLTPAGGGVDMSEMFAKLRTCKACVEAGAPLNFCVRRARSHPTPDAMRARRYGWCPMRRAGFAAKECGDDERYHAEGLRRQEGAAVEAAAPRRRSRSPQRAAAPTCAPSSPS